MDSEISDFAILDSLNEEIAVLDESGIIVHINHTWGQSIHNMDRNLIKENIIGVNYLDVCRNSYLNSNDSIAKKVLDGLEKIYNLEINNFSMEYPCHTPKIQQWYLLQAARIQNTKRIILSHTDITEQILTTLKEKEKTKRLEKRIERKSETVESLKSSLHRKMIEIIRKDSALLEKEDEVYQAFLKERDLIELKKKLISTISHEVRTPLTNIHLSAEILVKYQTTLDEKSKQKYLEEIPKSCKRISQILENFFFINNFEANDKTIKLSTIDLRVLVEDVFSDLEQMPIENNTRIICDELGTDPLYIKMDTSLVKQIILQLLSNALKYSNEDSKIFLKFNLSEKELSFSVQDFGIGIPEIDKDKIFDSFYRGSNIGNKNGVGLGLYIVKECVGACNGKFEFTSNENRGSIFQIYLPIGKEA